MAAPVGGQVLSEVLPYLELTKDNQQEEQRKLVEIPNVEGMTVKDATKKLKEVNLSIKIQNEIQDMDKTTTVIKEQLPKSGISVYEETEILVKI